MLASYTDEVLLISISTSGDYKSHPVQLAPLLTTERKFGHLVHTWPVESSKLYNPVPWRTFYGVLLEGEVQSTKDIWFFALCLYLSHKAERFFSGVLDSTDISQSQEGVTFENLKILSQLFVAHLPVSEHDLYCAHS